MYLPVLVGDNIMELIVHVGQSPFSLARTRTKSKRVMGEIFSRISIGGMNDGLAG
jgi:hypothetical protein